MRLDKMLNTSHIIWFISDKSNFKERDIMETKQKKHHHLLLHLAVNEIQLCAWTCLFIEDLFYDIKIMFSFID